MLDEGNSAVVKAEAKIENELFSDIEEGEIFDHDMNSPRSSENVDATLGIEKNVNLKKIVFNERNDSRNDGYNRDGPLFQGEGYVNERLRKKLKLTCKKWRPNTSVEKQENYIYDLISSEEEYQSDEDNHLFDDTRHLNIYNYEKRKRRKACDGPTSGTVEDIMSQIDEVVCRKNRCYNKRRRSKERRHSWEKFYEKKSCSCRLKSQESVSSHKQLTKSKRSAKCKIFSTDSSSERNEFLRRKWSNHRKKKIKDDYYYSGYCLDTKSDRVHSANTSNKTIRDFDEVRKNLLEKLKKEKEEKQTREISESIKKSVERDLDGFNVQAVELSNNPLNCANTSVRGIEENSPNRTTEGIFNQKSPEAVISETEGDDEMDLVQLRLIALASNKRRKIEEINLEKTEKASLGNEEYYSSSELKSEDNNRYSDRNEENDLDRNELLLRAEALKTALLKKHRNRLNKLEANKLNQMESSSDNDGVTSVSAESNVLKSDENVNDNANNCKESGESTPVELPSVAEDDGGLKKTVENGNGIDESNGSLEDAKEFSEMQISNNAEEVVPCNSSKKRCLKGKNRRKRKKSAVLLSGVKKSGGQVGHGLDEDCRSLRSQLLCDLIKKKSMQFLEKKSVLLDSMQKSARKPTVRGHDKPDGERPRSAVQISNNVKNLNAFQTSKSLQSQPIIPIPKPEIQRIIVHLGPEDSSDDDAADKISNKESQNVLPAGSGSSREVPPANSSKSEANQIDESVKAAYEERVMLLLDEARKKIEGEMQRAKDNKTATPEAIYKHLPPSQRLEYMRLKQKIAERERSRKVKSGISPGLSSSSGAISKKSSESAGKNSVEEKPPLANCVGANAESKVINPAVTSPADDSGVANAAATMTAGTESVGGASTSEKAVSNGAVSSTSGRLPRPVDRTTGSLLAGKANAFLPKSKRTASRSTVPSQSSPARTLPNQTLITKLKFLLKKIKVEKMMEENYEKEIAKLKGQLLLLEKKKSEQRFKIKKMADESVKTYKLIQNGTRTAPARTAEAAGVKEDVAKTEEKAGRVESDEKSEGKEAETKITESDSSKTPEADGRANEGSCPAAGTSNGNGELVQYNSPLEVFGQGSGKSARVDPNVIMCQFDLMGVCRDEECTYQHFRTT